MPFSIHRGLRWKTKSDRDRRVTALSRKPTCTGRRPGRCQRRPQAARARPSAALALARNEHRPRSTPPSNEVCTSKKLGLSEQTRIFLSKVAYGGQRIAREAPLVRSVSSWPSLCPPRVVSAASPGHDDPRLAARASLSRSFRYSLFSKEKNRERGGAERAAAAFFWGGR